MATKSRTHVPPSGRGRRARWLGRGRTRCRSGSGEPVRLVDAPEGAVDRGRGGAATLLADVVARPGSHPPARRRRDRRPPLPDELRRRGHRRAGGRWVARTPRSGGRRRRHPAGQRRAVRDHDPEPRHGLHGPRHAEGSRPPTGAVPRRPSRCRSGSTRLAAVGEYWGSSLTTQSPVHTHRSGGPVPVLR